MVTIMKAPLPNPNSTMVSGNTQHTEAAKAAARLTSPGLAPLTFIAEPPLLAHCARGAR